MNPNETTRRALVAGLALVPIAGVPAAAGAVPMPALNQAIARHKAAYAAVLAACGDEDIPTDIGWTAYRAFHDLVKTPCANDAELIEKLRYLVGLYVENNRRPQMDSDGMEIEGDEIIVSLDLHFNPVIYA